MSPVVMAGLPARFPELRENLIAVVSVDGDENIAIDSNRCGIAADWCIAAPGDGIRAAYFGPFQGRIIRSSTIVHGTSYAAPMVTGGLAVMKHFFRNQLSNTALVERLYATAKKTGKHANRAHLRSRSDGPQRRRLASRLHVRSRGETGSMMAAYLWTVLL